MARTIIVDYDAGNLRSVQRACHEVGLDAEISADPARVAAADRVIFPGVGQAGSAMATLRRTGLDEALHAALAAGTPMLGICLGLQISLDRSEEADTTTLGLIPGVVRRFALDDPALKIPHMGWNAIRVLQPHPVLAGIEADDEFYFVHGYYTEPAAPDEALAVTTYEREFCCALGRANYVGVQFHTEKSGRVGLGLIDRFARWDGVWQPAAAEAVRPC
ncbi:MAG TPA: imidazole glycerol phosphate synthase subunit HisH [Pseudomonadales bacterium]|nr:imidazole glycerol phosphate synthase subunit HisH [Pseudomonadales bacterium]